MEVDKEGVWGTESEQCKWPTVPVKILDTLSYLREWEGLSKLLTSIV